SRLGATGALGGGRVTAGLRGRCAGGRGCAARAAAGLGRCARVGAVEARALEAHADRAELLAQRAAARLADRERRLGEALAGVEGRAAGCEGVGVDGHEVSSSWLGEGSRTA